MFIGAHAVVFSRQADELRAFFSDVLELGHVDAGGGWLIFALPPAELAVHPIEAGPSRHELYLMCEDLDATLAALRGKGVACEPIQEEAFGRLSAIALPDGSTLGVYEPSHPTALPA